MLAEVESLLNYFVEQILIINEITQDKNKALEDDTNKSIKFHRLDRSMEESVSTFNSVDEVEQYNCVNNKYCPLAENENPFSMSKKEQGMDQSTKR